ncbi:Protein secretion chaperonin CsaA [Fulvivirga imtechensis AK7]|uniref:Protein secretion chaperonin CsaA n=1 Tax=Fulvivirga imtechensis AK7 TaxID=1237149 RepID=L8JYX7_9BACT|nr:tRNA-binding protein [Fulvivirga imtechensis]ELR72839.1 Protein secretion chaperonin CsaA [Fulvivirga imtechensis AK7]
MQTINWNDFEKVDLRVGTITHVEEFPEARKPAYKVWVDLGAELGIRKSSAQITHHYTKEGLLDRQVICVVNFPKKQIGPFLSEVLITGFSDENGDIILAVPEKRIPNGAKLH